MGLCPERRKTAPGRGVGTLPLLRAEARLRRRPSLPSPSPVSPWPRGRPPVGLPERPCGARPAPASAPRPRKQEASFPGSAAFGPRVWPPSLSGCEVSSPRSGAKLRPVVALLALTAPGHQGLIYAVMGEPSGEIIITTHRKILRFDKKYEEIQSL